MPVANLTQTQLREIQLCRRIALEIKTSVTSYTLVYFSLDNSLSISDGCLGGLWLILALLQNLQRLISTVEGLR